jgi:hypothetical protein
MTAIVDGVRRVDGGLKDDAGLDFTWTLLVVVFLFVIAKGVVGGVGGETGRRRPSGRLKFATSLPFRSTREPKHQPIIRIILLREMGSQEKGYTVFNFLIIFFFLVDSLRMDSKQEKRVELTIHKVRPLREGG